MAEDYSKFTNEELIEKYHNAKSLAQVYDLSQMAKKILLNSCYGAIGNAYFLHNDVKIARAITLMGQAMINKAAKAKNDYINKILNNKNYIDYRCYSDTDSNYIELIDVLNKYLKLKPNADRQEQTDFLDKFCHKIEDDCLTPLFEKVKNECNGHIDGVLHMDREAIATPNEKTGYCGLWIAKKRYYLLLDDMEGFRYTANNHEPHEKIMGLFSVTSTCPEFIKPVFNKVMYNLCSDGVEEARNTIKQFKKVFMAKPVSDIAFPKGVTDVDKFINPETKLPWDGEWYDSSSQKTRNGGVPINAKAAIYYNYLVDKLGLEKKYQKIKSGDKMKYVYLKENPYKYSVIGFHDDLPDEFDLKKYVDYETHYEKLFYSPVNDIFTACSLEIEPQASIDDFF